MTRTPVYKTLVDSVSSDLMYIGKAIAGSNTESEVWQLRKVDLTNNDIDIKYAGGIGSFNYSWDNRLNYTYS